MSLNIPSTQIYAGRYHHQKIKRPDLLCEAQQNNTAEKRALRDVVSVDTVTFSDEGLAKSKNWREYTKGNSNMSVLNYEEQMQELNRQLNTVNMIDTASMFNCELGEVASKLKEDLQCKEHFRSHEEFLDVMADAYRVIYDRIEEDFADSDRETTWILQKDGTYVEETKQDRINALNQAYQARLEFSESAAKVKAETDKYVRSKK